MAQLTPWLRTRCRWQRCARGTRHLLTCLAVFEVFWLGVWCFEKLLAPVSERTAGTLFFITAGVLLAGILLGIWRITRRSIVNAKTREYGRERPAEHDALEAAVELEAKSAKGPLRPFEQEYLTQLQERYAADDFKSLRSSRAFARPRVWPLALATILIASFFFCFPNPVQQRAWLGLTSNQPGLEFLGLPTEIERHQDLPVTVQINRHGGAVTLEVREDGAAEASYPMQGNADAPHLTLYDVSQSLAIRARTPFVESDWHHIAVYDPPAPIRIAIDTTPPAYTGRTPQHRDDFGDLELVAGETLQVHCEMPEGQTCQLKGLSAAAAPTLSTMPCTLSLLPAVGVRFQAEYRDAAGHISHGPVFAVTIRPDLTPSIELIEPTTDTTCKPGETPLVIANVTDDFGITSVEVHYFLDNQPERIQTLWPTGGTPLSSQSLELTSPLALGDTQLVPGQLLTGWLEATDNCEPSANRVRSELFFVTVTPDENSFQADMEGLEGEETHKVDISDLIVESKRLLRNTFDWLNLEMDEAVAERLRQELDRDLRALELAVRSRSVDIASQLGMPRLPEELQCFFTEAALQLGQAAADVTAGAVGDSRAPQQSALVVLVQLNNILIENLMKMSAKGGEGTPEPGMESEDEEGTSPSSESNQESASEDHEQEIAQMEEAREELRRILREQHAILDELRQANRLADTYVAPERHLAQRTRNVGGLLSGIAAAAPIQKLLRDAQGELEDAANNFAVSGQSGVASIHARRAEKNLQDSLTLLEQLLQALTTRQIEKLSEDARELSDRQRELSEHSAQYSTRPPDEATRQGLRDAQDALSKETEGLRQRIDQAARSMEREDPLGAQQLRSTLDAQSNAALQRAQSRARNALLYRRYGTAAEEQENAAAELQRVAERLSDVAAKTGLDEEQLRMAMEAIQQLADEAVASQDAEQLAQVGEQAARLIQQLGKQLGSQALQDIAQEIAQAFSQADAETGGLHDELLERLEAAGRELYQEMLQLQGESPRRRLPPTTAPPRQYRQEVEEYFRRLGE